MNAQLELERRSHNAALSSQSSSSSNGANPSADGCGEEFVTQNAPFSLNVKLTRPPCACQIIKIVGLQVELNFQGEGVDHRLEDDNNSQRFPEDSPRYPCDEEIIQRIIIELQNQFGGQTIPALSVRQVACHMILYVQKWLSTRSVNVAITSIVLLSEQGLRYRADWFHDSLPVPIPSGQNPVSLLGNLTTLGHLGNFSTLT